MKRLLYLFLIAMLCVSNLFAQNREVTGCIVVFETIPVVNAKITLKSSKKIVTTNEMGEFTLSCNSKDKLLIIAEGFQSKKIKINTKKTSPILVNLELSKNSEASQIAVYKGHILKVEEFDKLVKKYSKDNGYGRYSTVLEIIKCEFPTLQYVNGEIIMRGIKSITGNNAAKISVDGVIMGGSILESLTSNDIVSIRLLQGSQAAIHGIRGANGVVEIKTKQGS